MLDVFINVAAHIARKGKLEVIGKSITMIKELTNIKPVVNKDKNQIFQCPTCKNTSSKKISKLIPRLIKKQIYIPEPSAHRHLTKPHQRMNQKRKLEKFNPNSGWISNF